jgi:dTMP kinase
VASPPSEPGRRSSASGRTRAWGKLIVLEGPDGSGKSTQARLLAEAFSKEGRSVELTREPGGTALGERIRGLLLGHEGEAQEGPSISDRAELFLFMAARAQLVDEVVRPALEAGRLVVSERFLLSSVVYQGLAGTVPAGEVEAVGRSAVCEIAPDLTIVLDVDAEIGLARVGRRDRIESRGRSYHERVRQGFLSLARRDPVRIAVVDGGRPAEEVHADVLKRVRDALA